MTGHIQSHTERFRHILIGAVILDLFESVTFIQSDGGSRKFSGFQLSDQMCQHLSAYAATPAGFLHEDTFHFNFVFRFALVCFIFS